MGALAKALWRNKNLDDFAAGINRYLEEQDNQQMQEQLINAYKNRMATMQNIDQTGMDMRDITQQQDPNGMTDFILPNALDQGQQFNKGQQEITDFVGNNLQNADNPAFGAGLEELALQGQRMMPPPPPKKPERIKINPGEGLFNQETGETTIPIPAQEKGFEPKVTNQGVWADTDDDGIPEFQVNEDYYKQEKALRATSSKGSGDNYKGLSSNANKAAQNILNSEYQFFGKDPEYDLPPEVQNSYIQSNYNTFKQDLPTELRGILGQAEATGKYLNPQQALELFETVDLGRDLTEAEYKKVKDWLINYESIYTHLNR